jgi:hypothetical protein
MVPILAPRRAVQPRAAHSTAASSPPKAIGANDQQQVKLRAI